MISKIKFPTLQFIYLAVLLIGCDHKKTPEIEKKIITKSITTEDKNTKTRVIDSLKYKNKVWGKDEEGYTVYGRIIVEGKNGIGILIDNKGQEIEIVFEMLSSKKLIATDIEGFKYKLKIY